MLSTPTVNSHASPPALISITEGDLIKMDGVPIESGLGATTALFPTRNRSWNSMVTLQSQHCPGSGQHHSLWYVWEVGCNHLSCWPNHDHGKTLLREASCSGTSAWPWVSYASGCLMGIQPQESDNWWLASHWPQPSALPSGTGRQRRR